MTAVTEFGRTTRAVTTAAIWCVALCGFLPAQFGANYLEPPVRYGAHRPDDAIRRLQAAMDAGDAKFRHRAGTGYLHAVLEHLGIPVSSQGLVFSKTSFQIRHIAPDNPRAVYFSDDVYLGYVPGGDVLEVTAMDPQRGPIFYTLSQKKVARPRFERRTHECLTCHGGSRTKQWPGNVVRSVVAKPTGDIVTRTGSFVTTHESPYAQRWGGWYVTGTHGKMRHMGNATLPEGSASTELDSEAHANLRSLVGRFPTGNYPSSHSDMVALMVLEHQAEMHNRLARARYRVQVALHRQRDTNRALGLPVDQENERTKRVIREVAGEVLEYLLFKHEPKLPSPVRGTSKFTSEFSARGPKGPNGRSLFQLDLTERLFRYPCSYLIYSAGFDALPAPVRERVYLRLWRILSGKIGRRSWRLTRSQRQAILDILLATKRGLPEFFRPMRVR